MKALACREAYDDHDDFVGCVGFDVAETQRGHSHHGPVERHNVPAAKKN
jgi:hypothetical protein